MWRLRHVDARHREECECERDQHTGGDEELESLQNAKVQAWIHREQSLCGMAVVDRQRTQVDTDSGCSIRDLEFPVGRCEVELDGMHGDVELLRDPGIRPTSSRILENLRLAHREQRDWLGR